MELDTLTDDTLIMYNYHMYMHPDRTSDEKNVDNVEALIITI